MILRPSALPVDDLEEMLGGQPDTELSRQFLSQTLGQTASNVDDLLPSTVEAG